MNIQTGGPAFPRPASEYTRSGTLSDGNKAIDEQDGMTLRDWFAGQALAGLSQWKKNSAETATTAYEIADAMIAERSKKGA